MLYAHHIGNEIGKAEMEGRGSRAALAWRCRHLEPREVRAMAVLLQHVRSWLVGGAKLARTGGAAPATHEGRLLPQ